MNNIKTVNQILNVNGELYNYEVFLDKYNVHISGWEFDIVIKTIPISIVSLAKSIRLDALSLNECPLFINGVSIFDRKCAKVYFY